MRKKIVVSAINFTEGGPLKVLKDFLDASVDCLGSEWDVIALVNNKNLFDNPKVRYISYPYAKKSWLIRIFYEWCWFRLLSSKLKVDLWMSFHDITPNVVARRQSVYCHNPAPFYKLSFKEVWLEPSLYLFSKLYKYVYKINIKRNYHVVVQQDWIRREFINNYHFKNIVVAKPIYNHSEITAKPKIKSPVVFVYPALPRVFKNFELICEATKILNGSGVFNFEVLLTIDGSENRYSSKIVKKYSNVSALKFIGRQDVPGMKKLYGNASCLVFPSKLETWGLPISEAKEYKIPMILLDAPYARETLGDYDFVKFLPSNNATLLSKIMLDLIDSSIVFERTVSSRINAPYAESWPDLVSTLVKGL